MLQPSSYHRRGRAFTLIELLTVIAIIAILMALLFPAINGAKEQARKAKAGSDAQAIVSAVKSYVTEYGKFPTIDPATEPTDDVVVGDNDADLSDKPNSLVFNTLRAINQKPNDNHEQNPRRLVFFEGKSVSNPLHPREGFLDDVTNAGTNSDKQYSYFDPWERQYCIIMDTDYDNQIKVDDRYGDFANTSRPRATVGVFSMGKDNKLGNNANRKYKENNTKSDDILSWVP